MVHWCCAEICPANSQAFGVRRQRLQPFVERCLELTGGDGGARIVLTDSKRLAGRRRHVRDKNRVVHAQGSIGCHLMRRDLWG